MSSCKIWKVPSCKAVIIVLWKAFTMGHKNSSFTDGKQHKQQLSWETRLLEHSSYHENKHFCALSYTSFVASFSAVGMVTLLSPWIPHITLDMADDLFLGKQDKIRGPWFQLFYSSFESYKTLNPLSSLTLSSVGTLSRSSVDTAHA